MPYAALVCKYCGEHFGRADDEESIRRMDEHLQFDCAKYKRLLKKQNQRNLQPLPPAQIIGQAGIPSLGKRKP